MVQGMAKNTWVRIATTIATIAIKATPRPTRETTSLKN